MYARIARGLENDEQDGALRMTADQQRTGRGRGTRAIYRVPRLAEGNGNRRHFPRVWPKRANANEGIIVLLHASGKTLASGSGPGQRCTAPYGLSAAQSAGIISLPLFGQGSKLKKTLTFLASAGSGDAEPPEQSHLVALLAGGYIWNTIQHTSCGVVDGLGSSDCDAVPTLLTV